MMRETISKIGYKLAVRVLCDKIPEGAKKPVTAYLMGQAVLNQNSVFDAASDLYKQEEILIGIMSGEAKSGWPGEIVWRVELRSRGINSKKIFSIPSPPGNYNTGTEAIELVRFAKDQGWPSIYVIATPWHQVRSFISVATVAIQEYPELKIYNKVGTTLDWNEKCFHSQGTVFGIRDSFIDSEWDRIVKYENLVSPEEALLYLINRDK